MRRLLIATAPILTTILTASGPVAAADQRSVAVGSFDRVRVDGPIVVDIATGSPRAIVTGDRDSIGRIDLHVDGSTLVVRMGAGGWGERPATGAREPVTVALTTPSLATATVIAGAKVRIERMKAPRVAISMSGAGTIDVADVDGEEVNASLIGTGAITVAGRAGKARLLVNGSGSIAAGGLEASDLFVALEGVGAIDARARYTAQVASGGLGAITIAGRPKCRLPTRSTGPIRCGD